MTTEKTSETVEDVPEARKVQEAPKVSLLSYLLSYPFYIYFFFMLCFYELVARIYLLLPGSNIEKISRSLNSTAMNSIRLLGGSVKTSGLRPLEKRPGGYIVVSNHQSIFDICLLYTSFYRAAPRFIAKKQLAASVPAVATILRNDGSALIDRSSPDQALSEIKRFASFISAQGVAAVIFPEGTRSRDGKMKPFKKRGFLTLLENAPDAMIVPVAIENSWKYSFRQKGPSPLGVPILATILPEVARTGAEGAKEANAILRECEEAIEAELSRMRRG